MSWHRVEKLAEGTYRIYEPFGSLLADPDADGFTVNTYLVIGQEQAALVDSGTGVGDIRKVVSSLTSLSCEVLSTHHHWDHVGGSRLFDGSSKNSSFPSSGLTITPENPMAETV